MAHLDLTLVHDWIETEFGKRQPIRESIDGLIARCSQARPHPDWEELKSIPFEDITKLRQWIERPFLLDPPPVHLAGLWFGLFNPIYNGEAAADMYVCGSTRFDPNDETGDWATGPEWWPQHRYAQSSMLADIYKIAYRSDGLGNDAEYPLCLAYGALAVRDLLSELNPELVLKSADSLGVAVGFDSGDFVLVGRLSRAGLTPLK
jgi:hypothetical protein